LVLTGCDRRDDHIGEGHDTASKPQVAFRTRGDGRANDPLPRNRAPGTSRPSAHAHCVRRLRATPGLAPPQDCVRSIPPRRADFAPGRPRSICGRPPLQSAGASMVDERFRLGFGPRTHAQQSCLRAKASKGFSILQVRQSFVVAGCPTFALASSWSRAASACRHALHRNSVPAAGAPRMQRTGGHPWSRLALLWKQKREGASWCGGRRWRQSTTPLRLTRTRLSHSDAIAQRLRDGVRPAQACRSCQTANRECGLCGRSLEMGSSRLRPALACAWAHRLHRRGSRRAIVASGAFLDPTAQSVFDAADHSSTTSTTSSSG
jgi:hypothetical protein